MHHLAVVGNPIEHSLSPVVFDLFAKQLDIELVYRKILARDEIDFNLQVSQFFASGGMALNVTSPFKQNAYAISEIHTSRAGFCKASNFLSLNSSQQIIGDTTDGIGLVTDIIYNKHQELAYKNILIIGSGYVLDSILLDIIPHNPLCIDILARNKDRVKFLHNKFATGIFNVQKEYDIILNTTPNSPDNLLFNQLRFINDNTLCYDMTYAKSLFLNIMHILNPNIRMCNGLGMLVEQARVAFIKLFGKNPNIPSVFNSLLKMGYHV
jgi:shikimate dehydrogenase